LDAIVSVDVFMDLQEVPTKILKQYEKESSLYYVGALPQKFSWADREEHEISHLV
jgi:hypothetical protein